MIDIGANLTNEQFKDDLDSVIERAKESNVTGVILTSTNWKSYKDNIKIIEKYQEDIFLKTTYGLHPHYASNHQAIFDNIETELVNKDIVAIGEFGLDYFRNLSEKKIQKEVMEKFLHHAKNFPHLSLFLHERDAFYDFMSLMKNANVSNKSVVHCFTGTKEQAKTYLDNGYYIGITGWISDNRRNKDIKEALQYIPLSHLMIETDCPYLTPRNMPQMTRRNEPAFLNYVAKSIAEVKKISVEEVISQCTQNTLDFFNFSLYNNCSNKVNSNKK
jgi:TatD DNase family protein